MWQLFTQYFSVGVPDTLLQCLFFSLLAYVLVRVQSIFNLVGFFFADNFNFVTSIKWSFKKENKKAHSSFFLLMNSLAWCRRFISNQLQYSTIFTLGSITAKFARSKFIFFREFA